MDYEKKYNDALERAKKLAHDNAWVTSIFPELKESEDERIRKALVAYFSDTGCDTIQGVRIKKVLAYLEKQKEQDVKVISWREPDDCADIPEGHYVVIAYKPGVFGLGYIGNGKVVCAPGQKPSGILYIPNADESIIVDSKEQKPAEWSEEDENMFKRCVGYMTKLIPVPDKEHFVHFEAKEDEECINWFKNRLKSLRPQPHWKPSKEQINRLGSMIDTLRWANFDDMADILAELRDNLKKL